MMQRTRPVSPEMKIPAQPQLYIVPDVLDISLEKTLEQQQAECNEILASVWNTIVALYAEADACMKDPMNKGRALQTYREKKAVSILNHFTPEVRERMTNLGGAYKSMASEIESYAYTLPTGENEEDKILEIQEATSNKPAFHSDKEIIDYVRFLMEMYNFSPNEDSLTVEERSHIF